MRGINKQKFLTELGRLLTFMYEEDRERALAMYSSLFDETDDETGVLQMLVSPTRQAVNLARAYDARERKLQLQAQERGEAKGNEEPAFVRVIEQLRVQTAALGAPTPKVSADQFSLFEDAGKETALFDEIEAQNAPVQEQAPDFESFAAPVEAAPPAQEESADTQAPAGEAEASANTLDAFLDAYVAGNTETQPEAPKDEEVEAFMHLVPPTPQEERSGSMPGARPAPVPPPMPENEPAKDESFFAPAQQPAPEPAPAQPEQSAPAKPVQPAPPAQPERSRAEVLAGLRPNFTVSKPRVGLLILFLIVAVPLTLACIAVLLVPAALALAIAVAAGYLGVTGIAATFGSFTVFADILLVFGCTLIVLALGLLFLWIFIWMLGGVIPAVIRGVIALAHKWCYKEVPVQ